jgi:hypothetical protein
VTVNATSQEDCEALGPDYAWDDAAGVCVNANPFVAGSFNIGKFTITDGSWWVPSNQNFGDDFVHYFNLEGNPDAGFVDDDGKVVYVQVALVPKYAEGSATPRTPESLMGEITAGESASDPFYFKNYIASYYVENLVTGTPQLVGYDKNVENGICSALDDSCICDCQASDADSDGIVDGCDGTADAPIIHKPGCYSRVKIPGDARLIDRGGCGEDATACEYWVVLTFNEMTLERENDGGFGRRILAADATQTERHNLYTSDTVLISPITTTIGSMDKPNLRIINESLSSAVFDLNISQSTQGGTFSAGDTSETDEPPAAAQDSGGVFALANLELDTVGQDLTNEFCNVQNGDANNDTCEVTASFQLSFAALRSRTEAAIPDPSFGYTPPTSEAAEGDIITDVAVLDLDIFQQLPSEDANGDSVLNDGEDINQNGVLDLDRNEITNTYALQRSCTTEYTLTDANDNGKYDAGEAYDTAVERCGYLLQEQPKGMSTQLYLSPDDMRLLRSQNELCDRAAVVVMGICASGSSNAGTECSTDSDCPLTGSDGLPTGESGTCDGYSKSFTDSCDYVDEDGYIDATLTMSLNAGDVEQFDDNTADDTKTIAVKILLPDPSATASENDSDSNGVDENALLGWIRQYGPYPNSIFKSYYSKTHGNSYFNIQYQLGGEMSYPTTPKLGGTLNVPYGLYGDFPNYLKGTIFAQQFTIMGVYAKGDVNALGPQYSFWETSVVAMDTTVWSRGRGALCDGDESGFGGTCTIIERDYKYAKTKSKEKRFCWTVVCGIAKGEMTGTAGIGGKVYVELPAGKPFEPKLVTTVGPYAGIDATVSLGIDYYLAGGGVRGHLDPVVDISMPFTVSGQIGIDFGSNAVTESVVSGNVTGTGSDGGCLASAYVGISAELPLTLRYLGGHIDLYAYLGLGTQRICCCWGCVTIDLGRKEWTTTLCNWNPWSHTWHPVFSPYEKIWSVDTCSSVSGGSSSSNDLQVVTWSSPTSGSGGNYGNRSVTDRRWWMPNLAVNNSYKKEYTVPDSVSCVDVKVSGVTENWYDKVKIIRSNGSTDTIQNGYYWGNYGWWGNINNSVQICGSSADPLGGETIRVQLETDGSVTYRGVNVVFTPSL